MAKLEVEMKEIREMIKEVSRKIDSLIHERETTAMMIMSQDSLRDFLMSEPNLYSRKDLSRPTR